MPAEPMTDEQLEAIEARARFATPGPWRVGTDEERDGPSFIHDTRGHVVIRPDDEAELADLEFSASARTAIPALVAEVRRLRTLVAWAAQLNCAFRANNPMSICVCLSCTARAALPPAKKPGGNDG